MLDNINNPFKFSQGTSLTLKAGVIFLLTLLLTIPLLMVNFKIDDRLGRSRNAAHEIVNSWAGNQTISGPIIAVPYEKNISDKSGQNRTIQENVYFLPQSLNIDAKLDPEIRYRGIYKTVVYTGDINITGTFSLENHDYENLLWRKAILIMGLSDLRGLTNGPKLTWNNASYNFLPGPQSEVVSSGIHSKIPITNTTEKSRAFPFSINLTLKGSEHLYLLPLGMDSQVRINSTWPHPSFTGNFLPSKRTITDDGFSASWQIPYLARSYPQTFNGSQLYSIFKPINDSQFGVRFVQQMDHYKLTSRAVNYGILFIIFTFITFLLFEVNTRKPMHIMQYAMVGVSLITFFLILIALSEHTRFLIAYVAASIAITAQIVAYTYQTLKSFKCSITLAAILTGLYGYLYMTLLLEDYALIVGAISLFAAVCAAMFFTRNIDWYQKAKPDETIPNEMTVLDNSTDDAPDQ